MRYAEGRSDVDDRRAHEAARVGRQRRGDHEVVRERRRRRQIGRDARSRRIVRQRLGRAANADDRHPERPRQPADGAADAAHPDDHHRRPGHRPPPRGTTSGGRPAPAASPGSPWHGRGPGPRRTRRSARRRGPAEFVTTRSDSTTAGTRIRSTPADEAWSQRRFGSVRTSASSVVERKSHTNSTSAALAVRVGRIVDADEARDGVQCRQPLGGEGRRRAEDEGREAGDRERRSSWR